MQDEKLLKEARTLFNSLKINLSSGLYSEERIDTKKLNTIFNFFNRLLKKLKISRYLKDASLQKLINLADNKDFFGDDKAPTRNDYVEKMEIER